MRGRKRAEPHQRRGDGRAGERLQLAQRLGGGGAGIDDATAGVEDRPLGRRQHLDRRLDQCGIGLDLRAIGLVLERSARLAIARGGDLHVLGQINHDRAGAAGGGDMERLMNHRAEIGGILHQIIMLGAVARDADRVGLLKGIGADQVGGDLPGDDDDRDRIHQRVGEAGDDVGRAGAGSDQHDARLARGAGIAFRCVGRAALLPDEDVADLCLLEDRIVDREHGTARIAEHHLDTEVGQGLHQDIGTTLLARHHTLPRSAPRTLGRAGRAELSATN